ncbi:spore germination protein [Alicyclobacillus hesperidum URH17-3-68]|uniref:GerAB/ArcD/ProY family transporter n=1 Tax=Alicyclobacillus hesperidum TaxID=89784 RepID=UPI000281C395|nr:endospore germination permease [Alicyclobacillus hesperidum]EJY54792.1 spore germination protein [Alicyclobacillus hesperidum URH17-3-68]
MSDIRISRTQLITALIWCVVGTGIVAIPTAIAQFTVRDAWISTMLFSIGGGLVALVTAVFTRFFPKRSLTHALVDALGPWVGRAFAIWFLAGLYITNCTVVREAEVFIGTTILPKTPEYVLGAFALVAVVYAVYMGIEVVMRDAEFITPLVMLIAPILFVLSMQHMDIHEVLPVLADGWTPVLRGGVVSILVYALEMIIVLQFNPFVYRSQSVARDICIATVIITVVLTTFTILTIGVVGSSTQYLSYPVLEAIRTIRVGRFLERMDTLYVIAVITTIFIKMAVCHYAWCTGMKDVFRLSSHRVTVFPGALLVWGGANVLFADADDVQQFIFYTGPAYAVCTLLLMPMLAVFVHRVRRNS